MFRTTLPAPAPSSFFILRNRNGVNADAVHVLDVLPPHVWVNQFPATSEHYRCLLINFGSITNAEQSTLMTG